MGNTIVCFQKMQRQRVSLSLVQPLPDTPHACILTFGEQLHCFPFELFLASIYLLHSQLSKMERHTIIVTIIAKCVGRNGNAYMYLTQSILRLLPLLKRAATSRIICET